MLHQDFNMSKLDFRVHSDSEYLSRAGNRWSTNGLLGEIENTEMEILGKLDKECNENALCIFIRKGSGSL